ncbi:hypothetical protein M3650_21555 [Paenibacillus sp. MER TA 81-3]|nr:hypothetical protein [Paenibacillus sp. MER TA 81-3]
MQHERMMQIPQRQRLDETGRIRRAGEPDLVPDLLAMGGAPSRMRGARLSGLSNFDWAV